MAKRDPLITAAAQCLLNNDHHGWRKLHHQLTAHYKENRMNKLLSREKARLRALPVQAKAANNPSTV